MLAQPDDDLLDGLPAVEGGDVYRVPLANVNLDAANITETPMRADMVTKLVAAGFISALTLDQGS